MALRELVLDRAVLAYVCRAPSWVSRATVIADIGRLIPPEWACRRAEPQVRKRAKPLELIEKVELGKRYMLQTVISDLRRRGRLENHPDDDSIVRATSLGREFNKLPAGSRKIRKRRRPAQQ